MPKVFTPSYAGLSLADLLVNLTQTVDGDPANTDSNVKQIALTSVAVASNGVLLSAATSLTVASITGFNPSGGKAYIAVLGAVIAYTGIVSGPPALLTGVTVVSGAGTLATGMVVANIVPTASGTGGPNLTTGWLANAVALLAYSQFPHGEVVLNANWSTTTSTSPRSTVQTPVDSLVPPYVSPGPLGQASLTLDVPVGTVISGFKAALTPGSHGGSWPPSSAPTLAFYSANATTGSGILTPIATVTDSLASQSAYEANHDLVLTIGPPSLTVAANTVYFLTFTNEGGANSVSTFLMAARGIFV